MATELWTVNVVTNCDLNKNETAEI